MTLQRTVFSVLLIIGVIAAMITVASMAIFTDQVVSEGETATAGTLFLSVDDECGLAPDGQPRTSGGGGAGGGTPCTTSYTYTEDVTNMDIGDTASHTFDIRNDGSLNGLLSISAVVSAEDPANCFHITTSPDVTDQALAAGGDTTASITITLDAVGAANDNACQGATATVTVTFDLEQVP